MPDPISARRKGLQRYELVSALSPGKYLQVIVKRSMSRIMAKKENERDAEKKNKIDKEYKKEKWKEHRKEKVLYLASSRRA